MSSRKSAVPPGLNHLMDGFPSTPAWLRHLVVLGFGRHPSGMPACRASGTLHFRVQDAACSTCAVFNSWSRCRLLCLRHSL